MSRWSWVTQDDRRNSASRVRPDPRQWRPRRRDAPGRCPPSFGQVKRLTEQVGPIARLLVSKAAGAANNEAELYASLALAIQDAAERANFLRQFAGASAGNGPGGSVREATPGESSRSIPRELLDKAGKVLIAHLGPMARLVVMNESREAKTSEDLFQRLLARIPSESEKAELLKKLRSLHTG